MAVGLGPACSVIDEAANVAYVSNMTEGSVSAVHMATGEVLGRFGPLGPQPGCLAFDAAQSQVLVTSVSGHVSLLETSEIIDATYTPPTAVEPQTWGGVETRHSEP